MNWWKPIAALAVALLAFVAVGALADLVGVLLGNLPALVVVALVAVIVLGLSGWGSAPNRWLSNPYWGR